MPNHCRVLQISSYFAILLSAIAAFAPTSCGAQGFPPVSQDELKMTSEPQAPGAPAILLFREVDRDDSVRPAHEADYFRIKILTQAGRKYGNIEIPFEPVYETIVHIDAHTIKPDGTVTDFGGQVFEKTINKAQGQRYMAKTLTLPDVQVGSIVEYKYTVDLNESYVFASRWIVSSELFTRNAKFSLKPFQNKYITRSGPNGLRLNTQGLPAGAVPKEGPDHIFRMEAQNIPAFEVEDYMPPQNQLKARVDFIYEDEFMENDSDQYWRHVDKKRNDTLEAFIGKHKAMDDAIAQIVSPNDPPEVKLRKIYDRVQQLRNTTYEVHKTAEEQKREGEKPVENVEELWSRGYGNGQQLTWLYLALVRAAGFDACGVWASSRGEYFFNPKSMEQRKLNSNLVMVKLNGKDMFFDPGAAFTPFGMLTWFETATLGLCLDKNGGTWVKTPLPQASDSRVERVAKLKLTDTGNLEGKITVTYNGLEAMYHRRDVRNADEVARKTFIEDRVKNEIPVAAEVNLTNKPDWGSTEAPLVAEFDVTIPGWASNAGKRTAIPAGLFTVSEKHVFEHAERVHPIYLQYPSEKNDDVTIELPSGWQVGSVPSPQSQDAKILAYSLTVENGHTTLHLTRKLTKNFLIVEAQYYPAIYNFFQMVRTGDDQQIMLLLAAASASN